jgi:hypothetical protein
MKERDAPPHVEQPTCNHKIHKKERKQSDDSASEEERVSVKKDKTRASSKLTPMSETIAKQVVDVVKERVQPKEATNPMNKPVNQITTSSYLGRALKEVCECSAMQDTPAPSSDFSSSSLLSSSDSENKSEEHERRHRSKGRSH